VNDGSADETGAVLQDLRECYGEWVHVVELPTNQGAAVARNIGWSMVKQPYVAFLDADDAWHPKKLEIQYRYMQEHPEVVLSGHLSHELPALAPAPTGEIEMAGASAITLRTLLLKHQFVTPSVMVRADMPFRFDAKLRYMEDHRLWLDVVGAGMPTVKLQADLVAIYKPAFGAGGLSGNLWDMEKAELFNYWHLHRQGKISFLTLLLLQMYSLTKYLRRLGLVAVRKNI
jgi:glycosyltransferase involved in cell wall biosynthesis